MAIKTYRARSISAALAQIKADLGPDAVILHTRTHRVGGVFGIGAQTITEITATADMRLARAAAPPHPRPTQSTRPPAVPARPNSAAAARALAQKHAAARAAAQIPKGVAQDVAQMVLPKAPPQATSSGGTVAQVIEHKPVQQPAPQTEQFAAEIASLKKMVAHVLHAQRGAPGAIGPEALERLYLDLIERDVAAELADQVVARLKTELTTEQQQDAEVVRTAARKHVASFIPVGDATPPPWRPAKGDKPFTLALIGPTGVGKTTTVAKLAATYKLQHGLRVGLITCDTYRIAAVEQLKTYANIIDVPIEVASTPDDVQAALKKLQGVDVVLIDTAGRSQRAADRLAETRMLLDAAAPDQTHLVLASSAEKGVLMQAAERFGALAPTHIIFTKLDEAVSLGVLLNVAQRINAKLSFVTTGQEVPDHIEPGDAQRLATLVLEGELVA
ncbi:MAG: flagellar biosynthesis protein FlhF [Phycisphaerales bacterium]|nr:flagellar biosynthesis protein FlhF [Phycisphaerales bacterium]